MYPSVEESWKRVLDWLDANVPGSPELRREPPTDEEVRRLEEEALGFPLPPDLVAWWRMPRFDDLTVFPPDHASIGLGEVASIRGAALESRGADSGFADPAHDGDGDGEAGTPPPHYSEYFVPIAADGSGDHMFVDLREGPRQGCVMSWRHDDANDEPAEWPSLAHLLADVADAMHDGRPAGLWRYRDRGEPVTGDSGYLPVPAKGDPADEEREHLEWETPAELGVADSPAAAPLPPPPAGAGTHARGDTMLPGQTLRRQSLTSASGEYTLVHQNDGNVVLYRDHDGRSLWETGRHRGGTLRLALREDGDLVLHNARGDEVWSTGTAGSPGARLVVRDDGDVVLYDGAGERLWATGTVRRPLPEGPHARGDALLRGQTLRRQSLTSASGEYTLVHQNDGDLALYRDSDDHALWTSGTRRASVGALALHEDGDVVLHDADGAPVWRTGTSGLPGARLVVRDDGDLALHDADGRPLWATRTARYPLSEWPPAQGDTMLPGQVLGPRSLSSASGEYHLVYQYDGNLVLYQGPRGNAMWASDTQGASIGALALHEDGELVLHDAGGAPVWRSGTSGSPGARLVVRDDGDLVLLDEAGERLWHTDTVRRPLPEGPPAQGDTVLPGQVLRRGSLSSASGEYHLAHQHDGNLVLYRGSHGHALWATDTYGASVGVLHLGEDGDLVLYNSGGAPVWRSGTSGNPGARLVVRDDGDLVLLDEAGRRLWHTGTAQASRLPEGPPAQGDTMLPGQTLRRGTLTSASGEYHLAHQHDGNLVLYRTGSSSALWASDTYGSSVGVLHLEEDGDLVLYDADGDLVWNSGTEENPGARLVVRGDGNVVLYGEDDEELWATDTEVVRRPLPEGPPARGDTMLGGQVMTPGALDSASGEYHLVYQHDGNLVLYRGPRGRALWATGTHGASVGVLHLEEDGDLVLYDADGHRLWNSGTSGNPGTRLVVQDDGDAVLYGTDGGALWRV
ncbi:outer membrane protein assembly factor BamB family protein [Actinorugispora endophytica]|uniref:Cell wall assembly regulator SMI1 n=1 Tax=Actinorugispora endophytica TaxID=1605990 RepID=A0A4R6V3G6_9ACTN|nr:PQQ-binding-like beta-propeller repeat protein [Actinorugispora endophytica]TDQ53087.1 cell wall assembly regulator SMI1 [Actinorugispora endophytica]